jgi:glycosidase
VNEDYVSVNVAKESGDKNSLLSYVSNVLKIRNENEAFTKGSLELIPQKELPQNVLGYKRKLGSEEFTVLLNFGKKNKAVKINGKVIQVPALSGAVISASGLSLLDKN